MLKVLDKTCKPTKGSKYSACIDLYAREDVTIGAGETVKVPLGVCIDYEKILDWIDTIYPYNGGMLSKYKFDFLKKTHYMELHPRSSLRAKGVMAGVGVIDLDYKDEIKIILHNLNEKPFEIHKGDKIAQIMLKEHKSNLFGIDTDTERTGGFGSTGK